jgi:hypothetical protein
MDDVCCQFPHPSLNPLPLCPHSEPPSLLTWKSPFDACGANLCPHSSLVDDKLPTPYPYFSPPSLKGPLQFKLHVFKDDITTSGT